MKTKEFKAKLFRYPGKGGWTFAEIHKKYAPEFKLAWGRTPVIAVVDSKQWKTSVWTDKSGKVLLPVPKKIRGLKEDGDVVIISLEFIY